MIVARAGLIFLAVLAIAGCGGAGTMSLPRPRPLHGPQQGIIKHVVIIIQENRSVDNLFNGFPGADTVRSGRDSHGNIIGLEERPLFEQSDPSHSHDSFELQFDHGRMDGADLVPNTGHVPNLSFSFTNPADVQPYWTLAKRFAFADRMFQSNSGPSFPAHIFLVASQSRDAAENPATDSAPWGCDAVRGTTVRALNAAGDEFVFGFPCFDYPTLADELDSAGHSWRYYAPQPEASWNAYDAISHIRCGGDWTRDIAANDAFTPAQDFAAGNMADVTWVVPEGINSDHPNEIGDHGPDWVGSLVNAIGRGPDWKSTAIFIVWDDWGGWYDHVAPPQLDVMGLGMRVPLIIVSPYARNGYVSHVQHEFGSIMRFTEETFGLAPLAASDERADDLLDSFDLSKSPKPFVQLNVGTPPTYIGPTDITEVKADSD